MASALKSKAKTHKRGSEYPNEQVSKDGAETDLTNHSALIRTADQATLFSISSLIIQGPLFVARRLFDERRKILYPSSEEEIERERARK